MLISVPTYQGKSRSRDFGDLGFPWLAIANIVVSAAYGGWSYYMTKQQIEQAKRVSGADIASASDVKAITDQVLSQVDVKYMSRSDLEKYISGIITGAPTATQQLAPADLLAVRVAALEQKQGIPTWGWIALGAVGFLALRQFGVLKGE